MPFIRKHGKTLQLIHTRRSRNGVVRHQVLHRFANFVPVAEYLSSSAWDETRQRIEESHPEVSFDWDRLEAQVRELAQEVSPADSVGIDEQILALRRKVRALEESLAPLRAELDPVFLGASHDLRNLFLGIGSKLIRYREGDCAFKSQHAFTSMFFFHERTERPVDEAAATFGEDRQSALALFEEARAVDPFDPDIWNSEGLCWLEAGEAERAAACFSKAVDMARHHLPLGRRTFDWGELSVRPYVRAQYNMARLTQAQGDLRSATAIAEELVRLCPGAAVHPGSLLAELMQRQGLLERAIELYERWGRTPNDHFNLAAARFESGDVADGVPCLLRGMSANAYVVPLLLDETPPGVDVRHAIDWEGPEWADDYLENCGDLWKPATLEVLREIWGLPEVQEAVHEMHAIRRARRTRGGGLADDMEAARRRLTSRAFGRRLAAALAGS